jgi:hypothetical protein
MSRFSEIMDDIGSNGHLPIGLVMFLVGAVVYLRHGLDASFVTFSGSILTFLGGHMFIQNNNKGSDSTPTTNSTPTVPLTPKP